MTCHSCQYSEAILRGDYDGVPWGAMPCATCKLGEDTFYSVYLDTDRPLEPIEHPAFERTKSTVPLAEEMPVEVLSKFVEALMELPPEQRDVVAWRFQGLRYKDIAERQGTSTQLADMRHKMAMRDFPILRALFPEKAAKRQRWRSRRPSWQKSCQ
ncbi:RNA polymerase sigma factor [Tichowtungia aerotolerans]|uniref:RNA polymerase sigma factor 70 region 4 type 2 domain-containing protein n=1 Tax=Tichowtungia aerotolerans TaxID=2697043 RepID=A0A6P1M8Y2_9BACT|nr:sigma factor-like helix-turn-helix DNA-binding protein [Tichowtungia aerotolerans]QHI70482.1 hypothetical protein GT409_13885 [Tichowtungia aerotolerans]